MSRAWRWLWGWLAEHQFVAAIVVVTLVVGAAFWRDVQKEEEKDAFVACVARWANESSARVTALDAVRGARDSAADGLWRDFQRQLQGPPDRARFERLLVDYVTLSDGLRAAREANPVPDPPRIRC